MVTFSSDVDILKYEPVLFGQLHPPWQVLAKGTKATLSGTTLTDGAADFVGAAIRFGDRVDGLGSQNRSCRRCDRSASGQ